MKSNVFLSYTSSLSEIAERIELALKGEGFDVFRDRSILAPGESFDARIRAAIEACDLFVFLITPEAVAPGRYTLTELKFAEQKWQHPNGRVLPVFAQATPKESIPAYLRAVTILQPRGDIVAEVAAEVIRLSRPWWRRMLEPRRLVPAVLVALLIAGVAWTVLPAHLDRREQNTEVQALIMQSELQADDGDYAAAWMLLERASAAAPTSREVFEAQERLAMQMLRGQGVGASRGSRDSTEGLVRMTLPVLTRGVAEARGERLADLLAHMGWAEYMSGRSSGSGELDPASHYRRALEADPDNVHAHAMWAFELLRQRNSNAALRDAKQHFSAALAAGGARGFVRDLQITALLQTYSNVWIEDPERQAEVLRVVNEMRVEDEARPRGWGPSSFNKNVWSIYHFCFVANDDQAPLLAALPPAEHLASFRWLFPEDDLTQDGGGPKLFDYLTVLAQLEEHAGDRPGALASYRRLLSEVASKGYNSGRSLEVAAHAEAAVQRIAK